MSINHKFKDNIELLKFIKHKDKYYTSKKYNLERDINIFKGIILPQEKDEEFFNLWESLNLIEMFDESKYKDLQQLIISLIYNISYFHILFRLFDYSNTKIFTDNTILLFKNKYISLIGKNSQNDLNLLNDEFIENSILLIYLLDKKLKIAKNFIQNDLLKRLPIKLINKIFLKLISKFKDDLSEEINEEITNFFTTKENLKCSNLIYIFQNLENIKYKNLILRKISKSMIIEKHMIFYEKEKNKLETFIEFQKMNIFNDKNYENSSYVQRMISACHKILDYLKNSKVSYNELIRMEVKMSDLKKELKKTIEILNIQKTLEENEINKIADKLILNKDKIKNQIILLNSYLYIDTTFFNSSKHQEILELEHSLDKIKNGSIDEINKNQKKFEEYSKMYSIDEINKNQKKFEEYSKMYSETYIKDKILLSTSLFFTSIFKHLKKKYQNNEGEQNIFQEPPQEFKTLVNLFEKIPNPKIKEEIFDVCLKAVRKNEKRVKLEMHLIQEYFQIETEIETKFEQIGDSLKLYSKKNEIVNIINGISLFLYRKQARLTSYFDNLMNIKKNLSSRNINTQKVYDYLSELSKDNINIIDNQNNNNNDYLYIFVDFYKNPEAFDFLLSLNEENCRNLQEMIDISDNNFLTSSDIQDLEKCRKFL